MKQKILIVEDEHRIGKLEAEILKSAGFEVSLHDNGLDGYVDFQQNQYDLVISDIMLPGMDGKKFCDLVRKSNQQIPILVVSAVDEDYNIQRTKEIGADGYLIKPFTNKKLVGQVKQLLAGGNNN